MWSLRRAGGHLRAVSVRWSLSLRAYALRVCIQSDDARAARGAHRQSACMHVWSLNIQPAVNIITARLHNGFLVFATSCSFAT